jgi:parallel beta-helix repeat protein
VEYSCGHISRISPQRLARYFRDGRRVPIRSLTAGLVLLGAGLLTAAPAAAAVPGKISCAAVIAANALLTSDLTCTTGGLTLAGNAVLDLGGHRLIGSGGTGITFSGTGSPRVQNGTIEGWDAGIAAADRSDDVDRSVRLVNVSRITFSDNRTGLEASETGSLPSIAQTNFALTQVRFEGNSSGISGVYTGHVYVNQSVFVDNQIGIGLDSGTVKVVGSTLKGNGTALLCGEAACSLVQDQLTQNLRAVDVSAYGSATLTGNTIRGSDVAFAANSTVINDLTGNRFLRNKTAIQLTMSGATVTANEFIGNDLGFTSIGGQPPEFVATLSRNTFFLNADGIHITDGGTKLSDNKATWNKSWGIYAPHATDLGSNSAYGNGRSPQCVGVAC